MLTPPPLPAGGHTRRRVLLVEDHPMVREGLHAVLNSTAEFVVCAEAATGTSALAAAARERPEIVCLDLMLGGEDGFGLIAGLLAIDPQVKILILTAREEDGFATRCLQAGAKGFTMKSEANETLLVALRQIAEGKIYLSRKMMAAVLAEVPDATARFPLLKGLSDREMQVLQLIGIGWNTHQIADRLGIASKTVETHRENIKNKLGIPHATALVRFATVWMQRPD